MMANLVVMFAGCALFAAGVHFAEAPTAMLLGAILALCGLVMACADALDYARERLRVRCAARRNRRHWGPTVPMDQ